MKPRVLVTRRIAEPAVARLRPLARPALTFNAS